MSEQLEALVSSLLYEGYALYPYTPGSTKNATPTPFGIVYPPAYAERSASTFDHLRVECVLSAAEGAEVGAVVRFLQGAGERHTGGRAASRAAEHARLAELARRAVGSGPSSSSRANRRCAAGPACAPSCSTSSTARGISWSGCAAACTTRPSSSRARPRRWIARRRWPPSLLSTHVVLEASGGRFVSPLEREGVAGRRGRRLRERQHLAGARDPRRRRDPGGADPASRPSAASPRRASATCSTTPRSRRRCCCTCRSSATPSARRSPPRIPAVREMIERAAAATPEQLITLHGRLEAKDPSVQRRRRSPRRSRPAAGARPSESRRADARDRRGHLPQGRQGGPAPGHRPRRLRPHARRTRGRRSSVSTSTTRTAPTSR